MSNDNTNSSDGCTCGGCGTGTTCTHDKTAMQTGALDGVYVYAGPVVQPWDHTPKPDTGGTNELFITTTGTNGTDYRAILDAEMTKDLLERVRKLEKAVADLKEENLELLGSLVAIQDIMEDEVAKGPRSIVDVLLGNH